MNQAVPRSRRGRGAAFFDASDQKRGTFDVKIILIGGSEMAIVVADYSKIAKRTVARIAELRELHTIVSDEAPPEEWKSQLGKLELRWIHRESDL